MTSAGFVFWGGVAVAYAVIVVIGISLGAWLSHRYPGNGRGRWDIPDEWQPTPGPSHAAEVDEFDAFLLSLGSGSDA